MNTLRTFALLAALTAIFLAAGWLVAGEAGLVIAFLLALAMNLFSYWNADKLVLKMYRAQPVDEAHPNAVVRNYVSDIREMADRAGLPQPGVAIIPSDQPNAFATGRNPQNAAVAATTGLLRRLSSQEIAGVMAHELAHVKNRDTLTMTITATIAGAISMLANFALFAGMFGGGNRDNPLGGIGMILVALLAPLAAMLVQMGISRTREYAADRGGAEICGQPLWLASALDKIAGAARTQENRMAERNPATAHMFIINPLSGKNLNGLFSTHPPVEERVTRLQDLAREWQRRDAAGAGDRTSPWT